MSNRSNPTNLDTIEFAESDLPGRSCHIAGLRIFYEDATMHDQRYSLPRHAKEQWGLVQDARCARSGMKAFVLVTKRT